MRLAAFFHSTIFGGVLHSRGVESLTYVVWKKNFKYITIKLLKQMLNAHCSYNERFFFSRNERITNYLLLCSKYYFGGIFYSIWSPEIFIIRKIKTENSYGNGNWNKWCSINCFIIWSNHCVPFEIIFQNEMLI